MTETLTAGEDLASLLARGEQAAFHGPPGAAVALLEQAVVAARQRGLRTEATAAVWLLGQSLAAAGRYGGAMQLLAPLVDAGGDADAGPEPRLFASLAASTSAGVQRALGRHAAARELDQRALALSATPEAALDARIGLAGDAIGLAEPETAAAEAAEAERLLGGRTDLWRQQVRLGHVRSELAALAGDAGAACRHAAAAVAAAEAARAPALVARGLLVLGLAELQAGDVAQAATTLRRAATLAESLGALPVVWPSRALLGALLAGSDATESARSLAAARATVLAVAGDLPPAVRDAWLARPEVGALLEG